MLDTFLLLTPLLVLPVIGLLGFAGCTFQPVPATVAHVQTVVTTQPAGTSSISADLTKLMGDELIVAALQWRALVATDKPSLSSGLAPLNGGGPFQWNNMQVQVFIGDNPLHNTQLTVTATLPHNSATEWNLCVSAYSSVKLGSPTNNPVTSVLNYTGNNPQTQSPLTIGEYDLVYAVAFAANGDGTFPGNNTLTAQPGFTAESQTSNPLVEDGRGVNPITAQVNNTNPDPAAKGFIFAMGLNIA